MKTYEDFTALTDETSRRAFLLDAINDHKSSDLYKEAVIGYDYFRRRNTTINKYQKLLYTLSGKAVPDNYSANFKFANNFFQIFVKQEASHLLGNGITFKDENTKKALGGALFDNRIYQAAIMSLWGGVSFGFFNLDHIDVFKITEFVPLFGEEDGALHAGIRYWQIAKDKPLRITLYEEDGYTQYKYANGEWTILQEKRPYILTFAKSDASELEILNGRNYPSFPIVPLWANEERQSELVGLREKIDGYDLIQSGFANDLDDASQIYWTIQNAGGMDDVDLAKFVERMKTVKAAVVDEQGSMAEAHTLDVPYNARQVGLEELSDSLYRDAMALDTDKISAGRVAATAIRAAYEHLNLKCDGLEICVIDFVKAILQLANIEDDPIFKRSPLINQQEDTYMTLASAQYLDDITILKHLPFLSPDEIEEIIKRRTAEEAGRYTYDKAKSVEDTQGNEEQG